MWRNYATHGRLILEWRSDAAPYLFCEGVAHDSQRTIHSSDTGPR
jgi:hypothetical protein